MNRVLALQKLANYQLSITTNLDGPGDLSSLSILCCSVVSAGCSDIPTNIR